MQGNHQEYLSNLELKHFEIHLFHVTVIVLQELAMESC